MPPSPRTPLQRLIKGAQSRRTEMFVKGFFYILPFLPTSLIAISLVVSFLGDSTYFFALQITTALFVAQSFWRKTSFILGILASEYPFIVILPNLITLLASVFHHLYGINNFPPYVSLAVDGKSTYDITSLVLLISSVLTVAAFHLRWICNTKDLITLGLFKGGYNIESLTHSKSKSNRVKRVCNTLVSFFAMFWEFKILISFLAGFLNTSQNVFGDIPFATINLKVDEFTKKPFVCGQLERYVEKAVIEGKEPTYKLNLTCDIYPPTETASLKKTPILLYIHGK